jgi:hypothetical protein
MIARPDPIPRQDLPPFLEGVRLFKRVAHTKTREPMVVAICRYPLAAAFNGQGGKEGIRNKVPLDVCGLAQTAKDFPMAWTRVDDGAG